MDWPATYRARIKITTTSDWTTLHVVDGGAWIKPKPVAQSPVVTGGIEAGDRFVLAQPPEGAQAGNEVEVAWDVLLTNLSPGKDLILQIDRGNLGKTEVVIYNYIGSEPVEVKTFEWDKVTAERNSYQITVPSDLLINSSL
jgi:hypothetical protein